MDWKKLISSIVTRQYFEVSHPVENCKTQFMSEYYSSLSWAHQYFFNPKVQTGLKWLVDGVWIGVLLKGKVTMNEAFISFSKLLPRHFTDEVQSILYQHVIEVDNQHVWDIENLVKIDFTQLKASEGINLGNEMVVGNISAEPSQLVASLNSNTVPVSAIIDSGAKK